MWLTVLSVLLPVSSCKLFVSTSHLLSIAGDFYVNILNIFRISGGDGLTRRVRSTFLDDMF